METEVRVQLPRPNCAYCKAPVEIGETKRACEGCMSWSHLECAELHGGCPACGAGTSHPASTGAEARETASKVSPASAQGPGEAASQVLQETAEGEGAADRQRLARGASPLLGSAQPTKLFDLLILTVVGLSFFAICFIVGMMALTLLERQLGLFNEADSTGALLGCAAMLSVLATPIFVLLAATKIESWRKELRPLEPDSSKQD